MAGRAVGVTDLLVTLPDWVVAAFALVTQLGDAWFLFGSFSLLYWLGPSRSILDRRAGATLVGLGLVAVSLTVGAKALFGFPRPPGAGTATVPLWLPAVLGDVYVNAATGDGFGFPSGHALGSTVAYGGAALLLDVWDRRRRLLAAGAVVSLVSLSRLVLGVHYLVDVVVGVGLGVGVLLVAVRLTERGTRPARLFALAVGLAVGAVALSLLHGEAVESTAILGSTCGALVGWRYAESDVAGDRRTVSLPAVGLGLTVAGGLFVGSLAADPPLPVVFVLNVASVGLVLALPGLVGR